MVQGESGEKQFINMPEYSYIRKGLKERFLNDLTSSEKLFFLKKAQESLLQKGYPASEDLYHYCYFLALKERLRSISSSGGEGFLRVLHVHGMKDMEDVIKLHEERLKENKRSAPDEKGYEFIEYFSKLL